MRSTAAVPVAPSSTAADPSSTITAEPTSVLTPPRVHTTVSAAVASLTVSASMIRWMRLMRLGMVCERELDLEGVVAGVPGGLAGVAVDQLLEHQADTGVGVFGLDPGGRGA